MDFDRLRTLRELSKRGTMTAVAEALRVSPSAVSLAVVTVSVACVLDTAAMLRANSEVSVKVAEHDLLPAVEAHPDAIVLADGFSCRTQLQDLQGRQALTFAELLAHELSVEQAGR